MDKCWQSHAESRLKLADCINGTAGGDRKRKKRRGGRKEEGSVSLVSLKLKVRIEQGGGDGLFFFSGTRGEEKLQKKEKKRRESQDKMHLIFVSITLIK